MRGISHLSLLVALAACAVDASSNLTRDMTGGVLGSAVQRDTSLADSQINLTGTDLTVRTRRSRDLADRYDEIATFDGGNVRYQRLVNNNGFSGSTTNIGMIQSWVDSDSYRQQGLTKPISDLTKVVNRYGIAQYAVIENAQSRCAVFAEHFWTSARSSPGSPGDAQIAGNMCYAKSNPHAADIAGLTTSLLQNIQVGKGVNAATATVQTTQPTRPAAVTTLPATTSSQPAQIASAPFKVAPVGTRLVTASGYFQITRIDGYTVTTVNAANQTGRWTVGLINLRPGSTIDESKVIALFPLAIGKEIAVEEVGHNTDRWRHTIKVVRSEMYTMKGRAYPAFVIDARDQSLHQDQGGFDRTRLLWYVPELGALVRQRTVQTGGPPVRRIDWDVIDVVPPNAP